MADDVKELYRNTDPLLSGLGQEKNVDTTEKKSKHTPKRTPFQRQQDIELETRLCLEGKTQAEIAARVGVSRQQIQKDLAQVVKGWRKEAVAHIDEAINRELARLDHIEREAWAAWHASRSEKQRATVASKEGPDGTTIERRIVKHTDAGDPRFLEVIAGVSQRRIALLGLDKRPQVEVNQNYSIVLPDGFPMTMPDKLDEVDMPATLSTPRWPPPPGAVQ